MVSDRQSFLSRASVQEMSAAAVEDGRCAAELNLTASQVQSALQAQGVYGTIKPQGVPFLSNRSFSLEQRRHVNFWAILLTFTIPMTLFTVVFNLLSFTMHYSSPVTTYFITFLALVVVCMFYALAWRQIRQWRAGDRTAEPTWYLFLFGCCAVAWLAAVVFGELNFLWNMLPYYNIGNLNTYVAVDPSRSRGQQMMDAGRVIFREGTHLDLNNSMAFIDSKAYCVAPITFGEHPLVQYDFWAVGTDCCEPNTDKGKFGVAGEFRCGEYANEKAFAGLRVMDEAARAKYRLAVQHAEAMYNIHAETPIFFHWVQDPIGKVQSMHDRGLQYYLLGIFSFFALLLFCEAVATVVLAAKAATLEQ